MARKKLEEMTNGELYKHYRNQSYIAKGGKWASIITPFAVIFGVKAHEYIEILGDQAYKLTIGGVLAVIVAVICVYKEFKHDEKKKPFASILGWGIALAIIYFLEVVMRDLLLIVGAEFEGQVVAKGFDIWGIYTSEEAKEYKTIAREDKTLHRSKFSEKTDKIKAKIEKHEKEVQESRRRATE